MVSLAGGAFLIGSQDRFAYPADGEGPVREVELSPFWIDRCAVSNRQFARFVAETGYRTEAEEFGWSFVFGGLLPDDFPPTRAVASAPWWRQVEGATWRQPEGPQSDVEARLEHPVVHVSCAAVPVVLLLGRQAASDRGGVGVRGARRALEGRAFPWGDELEPAGGHRMNVWQGSFPDANSTADGFLGACPVDAFEPDALLGCTTRRATSGKWTRDWFHPRLQGARRAPRPGGTSQRHAQGAKGRFVPLPRVVLPPVSRGGPTGEHGGQLGRKRRLSVRPQCRRGVRPLIWVSP